MGQELASGYVEIGARIQGLERGLADANRRLKDFGDQAERHSRQVQASASGMGRWVARGALAATVGLGVAVKVAGDFEQQMNNLAAVSGASAKDLERLKRAALRLGASTKFSAREVAGAQTELAKAGLSTAQILGGGLRAALALAAAGNLEVADAAAYTSNAMNLFGLRGAAATKIADAFAVAANSTSADVRDFGMALTQGGSAAKSAGLNFTQTMVALTALAKQGIKGSDAGTSLKAALVQLVNPTRQQADAAKAAGISFLDASGRMRSMAEISRTLRERTAGLTQAQRTALFATLAGTDGLRTLTALYATGPAQLERYSRGLERQGEAARTANRMNQGTKASMEQFTGAIESAAITLTTALLPTLTQAAQEGARFIDQLTSSGEFQAFARDLGSVVGAGFRTVGASAQAAMPAVAALADVFSVLANTPAGPAILGAAAAVWTLTTAMKAGAAAGALMGRALNANPWVLAAGAILTVVGAYAGYRVATQGAASETDHLAGASQRASAALRGLQSALDRLTDSNLRVRSAEIELRSAQGARRQVIDQIRNKTLTGAAAEEALARANLNVRRAQVESTRATRDQTSERVKAVAASQREAQQGLSRVQTLTREVQALRAQQQALQKLPPSMRVAADGTDRLDKVTGQLRQRHAQLNNELRRFDSQANKANRLLLQTANEAGPRAGKSIRETAQAFRLLQAGAKADALFQSSMAMREVWIQADAASGKIQNVGMAMAGAAAQATALALQVWAANAALAALPSSKTVTVTTRSVSTGGGKGEKSRGAAPLVTVDQARNLLGSSAAPSLTDVIAQAQEFGLAVDDARQQARLLNQEIQQTERLQAAITARQQAQQKLTAARQQQPGKDRSRQVAAAQRELAAASREVAQATAAAGGGLDKQRQQLAAAAQGARGARSNLQGLVATATAASGAVSAAFSRFRDQQMAMVDAPYQDTFRRVGGGIELVRGAFSRLEQDQDAATAAVDQRLAATLDGIERWRGALTPAEQAIRAMEDAASAEGLQQSLGDAQQALNQARKSGNRSEIEQAIRRVQEAEREVRLAELRKTAEAERAERDAEAERQRAAADASAAAARQAVTDEYTARRLELEAQQQAERDARQTALDDMERQLGRMPAILAAARGQNTPQLRAMVAQFDRFGGDAGAEFVRSLTAELGKVGTRISRVLADSVRPYLELHSPAERGPLASLDTWWRALPATLMQGVGPEMDAQLAALANPAVTAGGGTGVAAVPEVHFHLDGTFLGDDRRMVEDLARLLKPAIDRQVTLRV